MSDSIAYVLEAKVKPGKRADLDVLVKEFSAATEDHAGVMNYEFFIDGDDFRAIERFANSADTMAHLGWFGENGAARFGEVADITGLTVFGSPSPDLRAAMEGMGGRVFEPCGGFRR